MPESQQCRIWATSVTYTTAHGNTRSLTCCATREFVFPFFFFLFFRAPPLAYGSLRLGVQSELQLLAYTTAIAMWDLSHICDLHHGLQQCWILNSLSKARDRTHILSRVHLPLSHNGTPGIFFFFFFLTTPTACGSSQARDQTCTTTVTWATAVTRGDL